MANFITRSLLRKQIAGFLVVTVVPMSVVGYFAFTSARQALGKAEFEKLSEAEEGKKRSILEYLRGTITNMEFLSELPAVQKGFRELEAYRDSRLQGAHASTSPDTPVDLSHEAYRKVASEMSSVLGKWLSLHEAGSAYDDVLVITGDSRGDVLYTEKKLSDLGTNLKTGPLRAGALAVLWKKVIETKKPAMVDYSQYAPTGKPAAFMGVPLRSQPGKASGVLAVRLGVAHLKGITDATKAVGTRGQTYLVGRDLVIGGTSRSQSDASHPKATGETAASGTALQDIQGTEVVNTGGEMVFRRSSRVGLSREPGLGADFDWSLVGEIRAVDAIGPAIALRNRVVLIAVGITLLVSVVGLFLARSLSRPILALAGQVGKVGRGDLTAEIPFQKRADELGALAKAVGVMVVYVKSQVGQVMQAAKAVAASASEITSAVTQLTKNTAKIGDAVSESATTAEQVKQSAELIGQKARGVADTSQRAVQTSNEGSEATEETARKMHSIKQQMESIGETVIRLSEHSRVIEEIMDSVQDIAHQSNLLAVNASIEAARAGDEGRGFAVVASEIKSLADQSKEATDRVRSILEDTRKWVDTAVTGTEQSAKAVEAGVQQASLAGESIKALARSVREWSQAAMVVDTASEQQVVGAEQVSLAMSNVDQAMRQNLEGISQLENTARELEELATSVTRMLAKYKT